MNQMVVSSLQQQLDLKANHQGSKREIKNNMKMEESMQGLQKPYIII